MPTHEEMCRDCGRAHAPTGPCPPQPRATFYTTRIRETLAALGLVGLDPAVVEAWMRVEHGTLDGLSRTRWAVEVEIAAQCALASHPETNRDAALSFGLTPCS